MLISLLTCSAISALGMVTAGSNLCTNFILYIFFFFFLFLHLFLSSLQPGYSLSGNKHLFFKTKPYWNLKGNSCKSFVHIYNHACMHTMYKV